MFWSTRTLCRSQKCITQYRASITPAAYLTLCHTGQVCHSMTANSVAQMAAEQTCIQMSSRG